MVPLVCSMLSMGGDYPYIKTNGGIWFDPYTAGVIATRLQDWAILTNEVELQDRAIALAASNYSNAVLLRAEERRAAWKWGAAVAGVAFLGGFILGVLK